MIIRLNLRLEGFRLKLSMENFPAFPIYGTVKGVSRKLVFSAYSSDELSYMKTPSNLSFPIGNPQRADGEYILNSFIKNSQAWKRKSSQPEPEAFIATALTGIDSRVKQTIKG